jgi:hypothetical protein
MWVYLPLFKDSMDVCNNKIFWQPDNVRSPAIAETADAETAKSSWSHRILHLLHNKNLDSVAKKF